MGANIEVVLEDVGDPERDNLTVVEVRTPDFENEENASVIAARIRHFGDRDVRDAPVEVVINGEVVVTQTVDLTAGGDTDVAFRPSLRAGEIHSGWVSVEGDRLEADNRRYFAFRSPHQFAVLCVDGGSRDQVGATYFLQRALSPCFSGQITLLTGSH